MSALDTLRDAIYGNPAVDGFKPSRSGVLKAFSELFDTVNSVVSGFRVYATVALMNADTTRAAGTLAYVYANNGSTSDAANGVYQYSGTAWVVAVWYFNGVAAVVQPLVTAAQTAATQAAASAVISVSSVASLFADGGGINAYPSVNANLVDSSLSKQIWLNQQLAPRAGLMKTIRAFCKQVGTVTFGFVSPNGDIQSRTTVTFGALGPQEIPVTNVPFRKGWYFGQIPNASDTGLIGYYPFGYAYNAALTAGTNTGALTINRDVSIAASYTADAADQSPIFSDLTELRVPLFSVTPTALPDGWYYSGPAWTFSAAGMTSPASGQGWNTFVQTNWWTRLEQRLTRVRLLNMTTATVVGICTLAPNQNAPLYEGNGRGPSMVAINWPARTLDIKNQPNGSGDQGNVASIALASGHVATNPHVVEVSWKVRTIVVTLIDTVTLAKTTVTDNRDTQTDTGNPAGNMNDALAFMAVAGQFTIAHAKICYDRPRSKTKVLILGDSNTQGDQTLASKRWATLLDNELNGAVAISGMGGGKARGAFYTAVAEIAALKPAWVILAVGTNGADNDLPQIKEYFENILFLCKTYKCKLVLTPLINTDYGNSQGTYNQYNGYVTSLQALFPNDIVLWYWNRAATVNGDGSTVDLSLYRSDKVHWSDAGHAKLPLQLHADVPQLFD